MFVPDENISVNATLKVSGIGRAVTMLKKIQLPDDIFLLSGPPTVPASWLDTTVGFIIANAADKNAWENLQQAMQCAKQQKVLTVPIFISENPLSNTEGIMLMNPRRFSGDIELYAYIVESIKSIQAFISKPGLVNLELEDIRELFKVDGRFAFAYYEYPSTANKYTAVHQVIQQLNSLGVPAQSGKLMVLNITGSEEYMSMFDIAEISTLFYEELGNNDCNMIWGATIDETLGDRIRLAIWMKV